MIEKNTEGRIVNTASISGRIYPHLSASYIVPKHAVVALSEQLYNELAMREAQIGVSVLCKSFVNTQLMNATRNLPCELRDGAGAKVK